MKLEPGIPCFIVNSRYNNNKVVTLAKFLGDRVFRYSNGENITHKAWLLNEPLDTGDMPLHGPDDVYTCPEFNLKPLDNPGDDETDIHSFRKEDECV